MATLKLNSLYCIRKQDVTGKDEPRIKVNGDAVWNGSVDKGGMAIINRSVSFENLAVVSAEEMNNDNPKPIGVPITVRESGNPEKLTFTTSGAHYEVYFEVTE